MNYNTRQIIESSLYIGEDKRNCRDWQEAGEIPGGALLRADLENS